MTAKDTANACLDKQHIKVERGSVARSLDSIDLLTLCTDSEHNIVFESTRAVEVTERQHSLLFIDKCVICHLSFIDKVAYPYLSE